MVVLVLAAFIAWHAWRKVAAKRYMAKQDVLSAAAKTGTPCLLAVVYRTHVICPIGAAITERLFPDTAEGRGLAWVWAKKQARYAEWDITLDGYGINYAVRPFHGTEDYHDFWRFREDPREPQHKIQAA